jgi:hypothetical protein
MATAVLLSWAGVTREQYDEVLEKLGLDADPPAGGLFHIAGVTDDGLRVVDVWESAEAFQRFVGERLTPAVQAVGIETQPDAELVEIHNVYAPGVSWVAEAGATSTASGVRA